MIVAYEEQLCDIFETDDKFEITYSMTHFLSGLSYIGIEDYPIINRPEMTGIARKHIPLLKGKAGLYSLWNSDGKCLYVGQTNNLYMRLYQHLIGATNTSGFIDQVSYIGVTLCDYGFIREIYETVAISELKPLYNKSKVFYKRKGVNA